MNASSDQSTTSSTAGLPADLPGRAVDVVHAVVRTAGVRLTGMSLSFQDDPADGLYRIIPSLGSRDIASAQALIAALGAVAEISEPYGPAGRRQVNVEASIPALGGLRVEIIATEGLPPEAGDPTELIADVDARRSTAITAAITATATATATDASPRPASAAPRTTITQEETR